MNSKQYNDNIQAIGEKLSECISLLIDCLDYPERDRVKTRGVGSLLVKTSATVGEILLSQDKSLDK